jgi:hypothetical protein
MRSTCAAWSSCRAADRHGEIHMYEAAQDGARPDARVHMVRSSQDDTRHLDCVTAAASKSPRITREAAVINFEPVAGGE